MKILITGGNGFIGQQLCEDAQSFGASKVISFDMSEYNPYDHVQVEVGNILDKIRLNYVFEKYKPDIVIHAAAYKHINLMETMPQEAINNNIIGTFNVFDCCIEHGVDTCIFISTDKASKPSSVYGLTKFVGEKLVKVYAEMNKTRFISAKFCNVYGSSGSVVTKFERCIRDKSPLPVTDFNMTRYFITVNQASRFIFDLIKYAKNGDVCMLYVEEETNIKSLAEKMCKDANIDLPIIEVGLRHGEKLHEVYSISGCSLLCGNIYRVED